MCRNPLYLNMFKAISGDSSYDISFEGDQLFLNGKPFTWDISKIGDRHFHIIRNNISYSVEILEENAQETTLRVNDDIIRVQTKDKMDLLLERLGMDKALDDVINDVKAPMPGLILKVEVEDGQEVTKGDTLMILEAMKMENVIKATGEGTVLSVKVNEGDTVEKNQVLIQF
mgnify:CR=1 FL=1